MMSIHPEGKSYSDLGSSACAQCPSYKGELSVLDAFVRHDRRDEQYDPSHAGHFDLWGCVQPSCGKAVHEGRQCMGCNSVTCHEHASTRVAWRTSICTYCDAYVCCVGECGGNVLFLLEDEQHEGASILEYAGAPLTVSCTCCEVPICLVCAMNDRTSFSCTKCHKALCRQCEIKPATDYNYPICRDCSGN